MNFRDKLRAAQRRNRSRLCVGLNIVVRDSPLPITYHDEPMLPFARDIIEATRDVVCAYSVDPTYFLFEGAAGVVALERIVRLVPDDVPLVFDTRFGGDDAIALHLGAAFDKFNADAATTSYAADDAMLGALQAYPDRALLVPRGARASAAHPSIGNWIMAEAYAQLESDFRDEAAELFVFEPDGQHEREARQPTFAQDRFSVWVMSRRILYASKRMDFAGAAREAAELQRERLGPPGD